MANVSFYPPVSIDFGGRIGDVASVQEASECLISDKWPDVSGPKWKTAMRALIGARAGYVFADEARQAFAAAALEVGILVGSDLPP